MTVPQREEARVLVVDDEEHIRRLLRAILTRLTRKYGVKVTEASNVTEALAHLERGTFHLIISDHSMPGRTGIDLLAECSERFPGAGRMLVTALEQADVGVEAIERGRIDAFLRKPFDNEGFIALVDDLLSERVRAAGEPASTAPSDAKEAEPSSRGALRAELAEVERVLRQLRVRLGLGHISADGFARASGELSSRRADLEVALLDG